MWERARREASEVRRAAPLRFFKTCFGALMLVYCLGRLGSDAPLPQQKPRDVFALQPFPLHQRLGAAGAWTAAFPWLPRLRSHLYWHAHLPLQLLFAAAITFAEGGLGRAGCLAFSLFQLITVLSSMALYNNHEYMYSAVALALGLCDSSVFNRATPWPCGGCRCEKSWVLEEVQWVGWSLVGIGVVYMSSWGLVLGIPGYIGVCGFTIVALGAVMATGGVGPCVCMHNVSGKSASSLDICKTSTGLWSLTLMRGYFTVVYFYAGVAKMEEDWLGGWTPTEILHLWTGPTAPQKFINKYLLEADWVPEAHVAGPRSHALSCFVFSGLLLDLVVLPVGLNMQRKSVRLIAAASAILFHISNHFLFVIETFPFVMIAGTAVFFDHVWIDDVVMFLVRTIFSKRLYKRVRDARNSTSALTSKYLLPLLAGTFLALHAVAPLKCALMAPRSPDLCFSSECQYFNWRMMTRSYQVVSTSFRVSHPMTGAVDVLYPAKDFLLSEVEVHQLAMNEDYLMELATRIRRSITAIPSNANGSPPMASQQYVHRVPTVYADIWTKVNGPPIQRYVDPLADIAAVELDTSIRPPWLEPRLSMFRTPDWKIKFRRYESTEKLRLPGRDVNVMYFAERPSNGTREQCAYQPTTPSLTILAMENTLLRVMAGTIHVSTRKGLVMNEGTCLLARGFMKIRAFASEGETSLIPSPALWAIRDVDRQVVIEPGQHGGELLNDVIPKLVIKKIFNCDDSYFETVFPNVSTT